MSHRTPKTVSKRLLLEDAIAGCFIRVVGIGIILAVFGIFVFIVAQVLPLFYPAEVRKSNTMPIEPGDYQLMGMDEWADMPFLLTDSGQLRFFPRSGEPSSDDPQTHDLGGPLVASKYDSVNGLLTIADTTGQIRFYRLDYLPRYSEVLDRRVQPRVEQDDVYQMTLSGRLKAMDIYQNANRRSLALLTDDPGGARCQIVEFERRSNLLTAGDWHSAALLEIPLEPEFRPLDVLLGGNGNTLVLALADGSVALYERHQGAFIFRQQFAPFAEDEALALFKWLGGQRTLVLGSPSGELATYIPYYMEDGGGLRYTQGHRLEPLGGPPACYAASVNNRSFLVASGERVRLYYGTTGQVLWESELDFRPQLALIGARYDNLLFYSPESGLHLFKLDNPHPEASWSAYLEAIRYEGYSSEQYVWQSTGGGDAFEPKLSLIPLLMGSAKGTFYALLFSVPLALAAAIYSAYFLQASLRRIIKPTMEIMASLPSVVLGFLGALWVAPRIDDHVPSVMLCLLAIPTLALLTGWILSQRHLSAYYARWAGWEFLLLLPILLCGLVACWWAGPVLEGWLFRVEDPLTGALRADFRLWWELRTGLHYEQRNALLIGFMMGFAVIPVIFTLSEDALSNVPATLVSGSLALGASRWETVRRIILPMALPGIFSALMIGMGRAVGETMIVIMATGNTPLTDLNLFSGMRTLSANLAIELSEASYGSTLYRTLFLSAMLLFILTFIANTAAELMREHIRRKYHQTGGAG